MYYTIYKLCCKDETVTDCYIGSTHNLTTRIRSHKKRCINPNAQGHNIKIYKFIRENGGWTNWYFSILEVIECNQQEAYNSELHWIDILKPSLNTYNPPIGLDRHTKIKCDCGNVYSIKNKSKHLITKIHIEYLRMHIEYLRGLITI